MKPFKQAVLIALTVALAVTTAHAAPKDVTLVRNGVAQAAIYVSPDVMAADQPIAQAATPVQQRAETDRRRLRESVKDLALYLKKMSGASLEVLSSTPARKDKRVPIYIGSLASQKFGAGKVRAPYEQGFRVVAGKSGVGLLGESDLATSYAIYELLDRLGCRWYLPSEMGEVVPRLKTISLPAMDFSSAPATIFRSIWYADDDFKRRNRLGGLLIQAGHNLENLVSPKQREEHPEWRAVVNGKPHERMLKWSHPGVQQAVADTIIAGFKASGIPANATVSFSLSPDDSVDFDQSDDKAWDAGDFDPTMNQISITDRYVKFCNIIAEKVGKEYPNALFGFLAYVQYTRPPVREKVHPNLVPQIAPITYCRAHAFTDEMCPSRPKLAPIAQGWTRQAEKVGYRGYMFNLAEVAVPYPMMRQLKEELPVWYGTGSTPRPQVRASALQTPALQTPALQNTALQNTAMEHTAGHENCCPSRPIMKPIVEGWGKATQNLSYYNYMFNLAEISVPYPMLHQMKQELPVLFKNSVKFWQPETMPNFESVLPGMVLSLRMAWNPNQKPQAILDEFFAKFYGDTSVPMLRYWQTMDDAWTKTPEHAGSGWGHVRRFTPAVMKAARAAIDEALGAASTPAEYRRVKMQDESLKQFERFMQMRWNINDGKLAGLDTLSDRWLNRQLDLSDEYERQYAFSKAHWAGGSIGSAYFRAFFDQSYRDGARIARDYTLISPALRNWKYAVDKEKQGEAKNWSTVEFGDTEWKTTDVGVETWSTLGLLDYMGTVWYRQSVNVPAAPAGKKVFLWIPSTDGEVQVWVNGKPVSVVATQNAAPQKYRGYCQPVSFDITSAVKGGANQIAIKATRVSLNELGTGGLLMPPYLYQDK
ncbi:MAG TPA: DUF4838 domain-containing protein [Abditibacteriaceae bacterium]|nr:DUF4838 domain-containing protein [Abditibacteriaceae bacterium]